MENHYPEPARYYRNSFRTSQSTTPSNINYPPPLSRFDSTPTPSSLRDSREKRRSAARMNSSRSIPHNGATCSNSMCDAPEIAADERLCPGPEGRHLCSRCYKRYKIERRRAKDAQRPMTNDWMKPGRARSRSTVEESRTLQREPRYRSEASNSDAHNPESIKRPSPVKTWSASEKTPSLHNFPTASVEEYNQHDSRPPRKNRSRRGRGEQQYARTGQDEADFYKYGGAEEDGHHDNQRCCSNLWNRKRKCVIIGLAIITIVVMAIVIALAVTLTRKPGFKYVPSTAQVNNTAAFDSGGATRKSVTDTSIGIGAGEDTYTYYHGNASNFPSKDVSKIRVPHCTTLDFMGLD